MEGEERDRLCGGAAIGKAEQRGRQHHQETEGQNRDGQIDVRRGGDNGRAQQQQGNADQCQQRALGPGLPHVPMVAEKCL